MKQPLLHPTDSRDKVSSTVSGLQRWTPISYQFKKYCSYFSLIYLLPRFVGDSKQTTETNSLRIDSAKDTCLVPLSNGTKIPH